eukprot:TRINITY_DN105105_c2_g1_i1.p1 TRINITY_DN105105_c2_g1~~TRINITY_DN105105_c2_g1_i1.p1  ORF type:complete len:722 (+),score=86.59 TRINITY_DN105105_c2_g1_i1:678-2843(+)
MPEAKKKPLEPMQDIGDIMEKAQLITPELEFIKLEKDKLIGQSLVKCSDEEPKLIQQFHKQFVKMHADLKTWLSGKPFHGVFTTEELILAKCGDYLIILDETISKAESAGFRESLKEMRMLLLGLLVFHMHSTALVDQAKLTKLLQSHIQSNESWNKLAELKAKKKKDQYYAEFSENSEKLLIEGVCTGNYLGCKKVLEKGKVFGYNNSRVVQLQNLFQALHDRTMLFINKDEEKKPAESEFMAIYSSQREIVRQLLCSIEEDAEADKTLQHILHKTLLILAGDDEVIQKSATTWLQYVFCYFMYQKPNPSLQQIDLLCDRARDAYRIEKGTFDSTMLELVAAKTPYEVLRTFQGRYPPWFTVHCMDTYHIFLKVNDKLPEEEEEDELPEFQFVVILSEGITLKQVQKEKVLEEYIEFLLEMHQDIDILLSYMGSVQQNGTTSQLFRDVILKKLDPNDPGMVTKVVEFAQNDKDLYEVVAQSVGIHYYNNKNYIEALNWLHEIKQGSFVNHIAKVLVDQLMREGAEKFKKSFDVMGVKQRVVEGSAKLTFIVRYIEFMELIANPRTPLDLSKAATMLFEMIRDKVLPSEYTDKVLEDAIPLMKSVGISTADLEVLMQVLTEYEARYNTRKVALTNRERVERVRIVLMEAYQNAIINEQATLQRITFHCFIGLWVNQQFSSSNILQVIEGTEREPCDLFRTFALKIVQGLFIIQRRLLLLTT